MSSGQQRIKWRRNIAKNFNRLSRVHERYRQTDRQTIDRQTTDGRTTTYSEREHEFTFAENCCHQMSDFNIKMHQNRFWLGLCATPDPVAAFKGAYF